MRKTREELLAEGRKEDARRHITRYSDASTFDEICMLCGLTDNPIGMRPVNIDNEDCSVP